MTATWREDERGGRLRTKHLVVCSVVIGLATACVTEGATPAPTAPITTMATTAALDSGTDLTDTLRAFSDFARSWNENQLDWIVAFQDPNVGYEDFLRVQLEVQRAQSSLVAAMSLEIARLPPNLQDAFRPIVDHYETRVALLRPLFAAAATGTSQQFDTALIAYQDHVATGLDMMETLLGLPAMEAAAAAEGLSTQDLIDALRSAFGG